MKAAVYEGIGRITYKDHPRPEVQPGSVLVKIMACAICGSDLRTYRYGHKTIKPPRVLGHESSGQIVAVGEGVTSVKAGDRVVVTPGAGCCTCRFCQSGWQNMCNEKKIFSQHYDGGFAQYLLVPAIAVNAGNINVIPDTVSYLEATLAEPLACVLNAHEAMDVKLGETVAVIGAGTLGCMHAEVAKGRGAGKVYLINRSSQRLQAAKVFGFDSYLDSSKVDVKEAIWADTAGRGVDAVFLAAGNAEACEMGLSIVGKMGRVNFFSGLSKDNPNVTLDANAIHYRQISIYGAASSAPRHNALALALIKKGIISARRYLTHAAPLAKIEQGFAAAENREGFRVVVLPNFADMSEEIARFPDLRII